MEIVYPVNHSGVTDRARSVYPGHFTAVLAIVKLLTNEEKIVKLLINKQAALFLSLVVQGMPLTKKYTTRSLLPQENSPWSLLNASWCNPG